MEIRVKGWSVGIHNTTRSPKFYPHVKKKGLVIERNLSCLLTSIIGVVIGANESELGN